MNTQSNKQVEPKTTISSRIPTHIIQDIDNIATETQRSRSFHIKQALELYAEKYQNEIEDIYIEKIIEDRLKTPKNQYFEGKQVMQDLGIDF
jgi:predicted DNA-binding protein